MTKGDEKMSIPILYICKLLHNLVANTNFIGKTLVLEGCLSGSPRLTWNISPVAMSMVDSLNEPEDKEPKVLIRE